MATKHVNIKFIYFIDTLIFLLFLSGVYHVKEKAMLPTGIDPVTTQGVVTAIDAFAVATDVDIEFVCDGKRIGDTVRVRFLNNQVVHTVSEKLIPYYSATYLIIQIFVGCIWFMFGVFVLSKRPSDKAALIYHFGSISVAGVIMMTWGCYTISPYGLGHVIRILFSICYTFTSPLLIHFTLLFPTDRCQKYRTALRVMYLIAILLSVWQGITFLQAVSPVDIHAFNFFFNYAFQFCHLFIAISGIIALFPMIYSYKIASENLERRKLRWLFLGLGFTAIGFIILDVIPQLLLSNILIPEEYILLITAATPVTSTISIVRYQLLDIDFIISRSTVYSIVLMILLAIYAFVIGTVAIIAQRLTVASSIYTSAVAAIIVALMFEPTRRKVQKFVDRKFFRIRYNYREVQSDFSEKINQFIDIPSLANEVVERIDSVIPVERIGFFILNESGTRVRLCAHLNFDLLTGRSVRFEVEKLRISLHLPVALTDAMEPGIRFESINVKEFTRWGMALVFPMLSEHANIVGFIVLGRKKSGRRFSIEDVDLLTSITAQTGLAVERITLHQQLIIKNEETRRLDELNRLKSYFVSSVSHELKTPLTSIKMFAELLQTNPNISREKSSGYLKIIEGESDRLAQLINSVLDFAKIERGVKEYHFRQINLNEIVQRALDSMQYQFTMQRCDVQCSLHGSDIIINADADSIFEALLNLLSNALKYTKDQKTVMVSTSISEDDTDKQPYATIAVTDNGIGIAPDDLQNIFEPFYRAKNQTARQVGGTGLGLSLVHHTMTAHHGRVEIQSELGKGSTFTLFIPIQS